MTRSPLLLFFIRLGFQRSNEAREQAVRDFELEMGPAPITVLGAQFNGDNRSA